MQCPCRPRADDATNGQRATADGRQTDRGGCALGTQCPKLPLCASVRRGRGQVAAARPAQAHRGHVLHRQKNSRGTGTPRPVDTEADDQSVPETLGIAAKHDPWHRDGRNGRPPTSLLDVSRDWCARTARGSAPAAGSPRCESRTGGRAGRQAVYAASAFRYAVMHVIICQHQRSRSHGQRDSP